jgi:hypothetical protein
MVNNGHALSTKGIEWLPDGSIRMTLTDSWSDAPDQTITFGSPVLTLQNILNNMDVPENRRTDLNWLNRNLGIKNNEKPGYEEAMRLIKTMLKQRK